MARTSPADMATVPAMASSAPTAVGCRTSYRPSGPGTGHGSTAPGRRVVVVLVGRIGPTDAPHLSARIHAVVTGDHAEVVTCDVAAVEPDLGTVDVLAHLQLTIRRLGRRMRLVRASRELTDLLVLIGWDAMAPPRPTLGRGVGRQAEQGEQTVGVEERVHRRDPSI